MAHRVISSDSEDDDYDASIGKSQVTRNIKRIVDSDEEEDSLDNPDISQFSSSASSSDVYSEPESSPNESFSPIQVKNKRIAKQRVLSDDEEDPNFSPPKDDRKLAINKGMSKQRVILSVDTREHALSNIYVLSDEEKDPSFSPPKDDTRDDRKPAINERMATQKVILSNDEDPSFSPKDDRKPKEVDNKDPSMTANTEMNVQLDSKEVVDGEVNTHEEETRKESSSNESNKENTSPPSSSLLPGKPVTIPVLGVSQAKPLVPVPAKGAPQAVVTFQREVPAYQVAHTRPALLKQLEYVKGLQASMGQNLPDKGANLVRWEKQIIERIKSIKGGDLTLMQYNENKDNVDGSNGHQGGWAKNRILAQQYRNLTHDVVEQLHSAMQSRPESETEVADPKELKTSLMPHQRRALAWALWRETQTPSGGILADDMGLGKTLTMLSLILADRERNKSSGESSSRGRPTLVVCPASLMQQWDGEITNHVRTGQLKVLVYHSDGRKHDPQKLSQYDVVITTYGVVGSEGAAYLPDDETGKKPKRRASSHHLFEVEWNRIILDEGHTIKNPKTNAAIGVCGLSATHRWVMTGTPVHNSLKDVYSLVKFIRLAPFNDFRVWKELVQKTGVGMQRLQTLMQSLLLRRTKQEIGHDGKPLIQLPSKQLIDHPVTLNEDEQCVFDLLFVQCRSKFLDYLRDLKEGGDYGGRAHAMEMPSLPSHLSALPSIMSRLFGSFNNAAIVLVTILRLLQCSCHLGLLGKAMEVEPQEVDQLETKFATMSLDSVGTSSGGVGRSWPPQGQLPACFNTDMSSSKVNVLLETLKDVLANNECDRPPKCVIVSQWSSFLDIIEKHVRKAGFTFVRIDGSVPPKKRNSLVEEFNSRRAHPQLLLMTLKTGGVGLNLTRGSHLFLMDLHWNPALEQQAADRIHRLGQTADVTIHRFICDKTAEGKIVQIQESKKKLATDVLSCTTGTSSKNKLTLEDLKLLFSV